MAVSSAAIDIVEVMQIRTPWMKSSLVMEKFTGDTGHQFIKLAKSCAKSVRLMTGTSPGDRRVLQGQTIIEKLIKIRNEKTNELQMNIGAVEALDDDVPVAKKRRKASTKPLPAEMVIAGPGVPGFTGTTDVRVLLHRKHSKGLWVHATADLLNYIRAATMHQFPGAVSVMSTAAAAAADDGGASVGEIDPAPADEHDETE